MIQAHQPGSQPIDIPEVIPNPAAPQAVPTPAPKEPVKRPIPQRALAGGSPLMRSYKRPGKSGKQWSLRVRDDPPC